jgi:thiol-disulfide isomerase/thioredoxin
MLKKILLVKLSLILLPIVAGALEVGDHAPCVVLNHIAADGMESEHCIREPEEGTRTKLKVLEFFSAVCSDCHKNLPIFSQLSMDLQGQATFRLVAIDRDESLVRDYIKTERDNIRFEVALDTSRDAKKAYNIVATPTLFVLDAQDTVLYKHQGVLSSKDVENIKDLVEGSN